MKHKEGDGQTKKRHEGENNQEPRRYGEKDKFSFHNQNLGVPFATKILPSTTRFVRQLKGLVGSHNHFQDNLEFTSDS